MSELGLDAQRNSEAKQAEVLDWQIRTTFAAGVVLVAFVFSWTDEWYRGGAGRGRLGLRRDRSRASSETRPRGAAECFHRGALSTRQEVALNRTGFLGDLITWEDGVMGRPSRFSPEVRERAVRMVEEHREAHASEWAVLQSVAPKLGCTAETLRKWVRQAQRDAGHRPGLTTSERERLKELEREVRELKRANEILRKASAYFAQAELDRRGK